MSDTLTEAITLNDLIARFDKGQDPYELTADLIDYILDSAPELARQYLLSPITGAVVNARRNVTRAVEREASAIRQGRVKVATAGVIPTKGSVDPQAHLKKLIEQSFFIPGDGLVLWLEATADQHRKRAEYQRTKAAGSIRDAEEHEGYATEIESKGVRCLGDLMT